MLLSSTITGVGEGLQRSLDRTVAFLHGDNFDKGRAGLLLTLMTVAYGRDHRIIRYRTSDISTETSAVQIYHFCITPCFRINRILAAVFQRPFRRNRHRFALLATRRGTYIQIPGGSVGHARYVSTR